MYTSKADTFIKSQKKPRVFDDNTRRSDLVPQKKKGHHSHEQAIEYVYFTKRRH